MNYPDSVKGEATVLRVVSYVRRRRPSHPSPHSDTHLVVGDGGGQLWTVQVEVDIGQLIQQPPRLPAVLVRVLHLQITACNTAQYGDTCYRGSTT